MLDIQNPLHLAIGAGVSANEYGGKRRRGVGRRKVFLAQYRRGQVEVFADHSPLWPFMPSRRPVDAQVTTYAANKRMHRRRGHYFYQMDVLVEDTATGSFEWRLWGVSYRHPVSFRRAQRDALLTFDSEVAGKPGTDLRVIAAIPLEGRRFE